MHIFPEARNHTPEVCRPTPEVRILLLRTHWAVVWLRYQHCLTKDEVLPRIGSQIVWFSVLAAMLGANFALAQSPDDPPIPKGPPAVLRSVKMISDAGGPALEIVSSQAPVPAIQFLDSPPRLVIDLPNTRIQLPRKRLEVGSEQVSAVRMNQFQQSPPVARIVVDLVHPVGYSSDGSGPRLLVHMHPMAEARRKIETPSVAALTKGTEPVFVPVGAGGSGAVIEAGSRLTSGSAVTASSDTTILRLTRGGEVRVCPKTTLSVTPSQNGRDLMLGMSTGSTRSPLHSECFRRFSGHA